MPRIVKTGQLERDLQNTIIEYLKIRGVFCWRQNNTPIYDAANKRYRAMPKHSMKGIPDILCVLPGSRFIGIEVKMEGKYLAPDQRVFHKACPGRCYVVRSFQDIEELFDLQFKPLFN